MNKALPRAVIFDLDFTLWNCWCDTHIKAPFYKVSENRLVDKSNFEIQLFEDVRPIMQFLKDNDVQIYTASRTCNPSYAKKLLRLFELEEFIDKSEWGVNSKTQHIRRLIEDEEFEFEQCMLFDDEYRNIDVQAELGVLFHYLRDEKLTWQEFKVGLGNYEQRRDKPMSYS